MSSVFALNDSMFSTTNTVAFGLSKDLDIPIIVKLGQLSTNTAVKRSTVTLSEKFENPSIFTKASNVSDNSDLVVQLSIVDGNGNAISVATETSYKNFIGNKRIWNQHLKLAICYNQLTFDSYLRVYIYEIVETKPSLFGVGYMSFFNHTNSLLRKGSQKIAIYPKECLEKIEYGDQSGLTEVEKILIDYENGVYTHVNWLDRMILSKIESEPQANDDETQSHYLYLELSNFELPIVYSDTIHQQPTPQLLMNNDFKMTNYSETNTNLVINSIDIPQSNSLDSNSLKAYDPDFRLLSLIHLQRNTLPLDPIELKYHKLERNINNNSILDKELKPSPQLRDELLKILVKPSNVELSDVERNLIWKFRYYFSKNNSVNDINSKSSTTKSFLPKFLKSINWDDENEQDHVFNEILPNYWSVDKIQIGDALELLSGYFNPFTISSSINAAMNATQKNKPNSRVEESKFQKVFKNITFLRKFAVERLKLASNDELLLYLLQLVQALKYESLIYERNFNFFESSQNFLMMNELGDEQNLLKSPLAKFLIDKSIENENLGNFFYWYVKVENEDQLTYKANGPPMKIYSLVLNKYIESLKKYSKANKVQSYNHLKRQIWFVKKLTTLVETLRSTFKKNEATSKKIQFLREYLSDPENELVKFPEAFPLPLDPSVTVCGCYPDESSVFKSSLAPLKITLMTVENTKGSNSQIFAKKNQKRGKYTLMFKIGDDLRQDQLVIQIVNLMDQLLKNENLDLRLTPYKILATSPIAGLIQFVNNETLDSILSSTYPVSVINGPSFNSTPATIPNNEHESNANQTVTGAKQLSNNGILSYLKLHSQERRPPEPDELGVFNNSQPSQSSVVPPAQHAITSDLGVSSLLMDNYVKSCAGYCVITYLLGVGDRHLDNLLLSPNGKFWHADFGYILGRDPKPFPPLMKLPIQVIDGMGGLNHENFNIFKSYCFITYTTLRKNSNLILNLFQLMLDANIPDINIDPSRAIEKVQEKFCLEMTEEEAILHFQNLINDSVNAFLPVVIDRLHSLAQYWRA